jgi:hypothetical protein
MSALSTPRRVRHKPSLLLIVPGALPLCMRSSNGNPRLSSCALGSTVAPDDALVPVGAAVVSVVSAAGAAGVVGAGGGGGTVAAGGEGIDGAGGVSTVPEGTLGAGTSTMRGATTLPRRAASSRNFEARRSSSVESAVSIINCMCVCSALNGARSLPAFDGSVNIKIHGNPRLPKNVAR